jgi:tRNA 2-selenouridine synthase
MGIQKITVEEFLLRAKTNPVFDVRSPGEYQHAHIQSARSLPLFNDEERKVVGTAYKQQGKQKAIKIGLEYFGPRMKQIVETVEQVVAETKAIHTDADAANDVPTVLVHCWRGGMRSGAIAWLLDLYGFQVFTLAGGYKAYRNWVLKQFETDRDLNLVGGYTGSGKTYLLDELTREGHSVIDLEALANHKGSAFGALGMGEQPSPEMFENMLAEALNEIKPGSPCWIEDESQRIGLLNIPTTFWKMMRTRPVFFLEVPFEERLKHIVAEYGQHEKEKLVNCVIRIQKRLGPLETKTAVNYLIENNYLEAFRILLTYYDKSYEKSLANRENSSAWLNKIECNSVDNISNTAKLLSCASAIS